LKKKIEIEEEKKETLFSLLKEGSLEKLQEFLLKNGKKKSYCPICFKREKIDTEDNFQ